LSYRRRNGKTKVKGMTEWRNTARAKGMLEEGRMYRHDLDQIKLAEARRFETDDFPPRIRWCKH
jgi:hypothetical protein